MWHGVIRVVRCNSARDVLSDNLAGIGTQLFFVQQLPPDERELHHLPVNKITPGWTKGVVVQRAARV